ncbi:uncharacterized protein OCT59_027880 [Rhizophagus irregularis]|nr:hypothetical protein RirG_267510 [Rhizophagus irregularis DAOM 197198w]UZO07599.1 hypothetical protein OCT59_027880 [Rhizophagus irregularis]GBC15530.2 hypothetical protein GLOIN_2v1088894 [Rhizophagus irregularis DAOM 181602=DAOM 197198]
MAEKLKCEMEPKSWLIFQLSHQLINLLPVKFRDIEDEEALKGYRLNIIRSIDNKIKNIFPIIYDEAQYHTSYLSNTFLCYNDKNKKKPLFTIITKIFSDLSLTFPKAIVCITGSGLSLMEAKDLKLSKVAKTETAIPIFKNFGQIQTSEEILELARNIFPLEDKYASMAIKWLKGRYRFTWTWIHYLLNSYDPQKQLEMLKDHLTTDYKDPQNPRFSLYSGLVRLVHHPNEQHSYIDHESILELIKRAIIYYAMTGRRFLYKNTKEIDIMSIGFAHLKTQELTGIIDEPLAIQAGFNYFINTKIDNMWFNVMSQVNFNASMPGFIWEKFIVSPICYPPNTVDSDISMAFFFPKGEKREAYILNTQVKLRNNVELKKACKTVNLDTMFTDKDLNSNSSQFHYKLCEIYKQQKWSNRNIQMIVAYPCNFNFKRKRDYQKTPDALKRIHKIPRLIIDENNADSLISNDCQHWVTVLKQE